VRLLADLCALFTTTADRLATAAIIRHLTALGLQRHRVVRWKRHHKSWTELWLEYDAATYRCSGCGQSLVRQDTHPTHSLRGHRHARSLRAGNPARCPRAALIYDHFHVIKPLSMAIDDIRRRLQRELPPTGRLYLKGSRYLLLRNRENLTAKQRIRLQDLLRLPANETLNAAYILKEDLRVVFRRQDPKRARAELRDWKRRVRESKIPELLKYVEMLDRRRFGILNFFITNDLARPQIEVRLRCEDPVTTRVDAGALYSNSNRAIHRSRASSMPAFTFSSSIRRAGSLSLTTTMGCSRAHLSTRTPTTCQETSRPGRPPAILKRLLEILSAT